MRFGRLILLVFRVIRTGKFRHSGFDPQEKRNALIKELSHPEPSPVRNKVLKNWLLKNSLTRRWVSETAYLKNSLRTTGGHLSLPDQRLAYIRIPKAASTSICKAFLQARFHELNTGKLSSEQINLLSDVYLEKRISSPHPTTVFFTIVRNPFARIVAVYRQFFEQGNKPFLYEDYMFGIFRQNFSFKQFLETTRLIPDALKDQHLKPQYLFLKYYEACNIPVRIMLLEERAIIEDFLGDNGLTFEVLNRSDTAYDYRQYYDAETLATTYALYREDVSRFGYDAVLKELEFMIEHRHVRI